MVYAFTGLPHVRHDFEDIRLDVSEFDARLGTPGLHHVRRAAARRGTILPPDLWARYEGASIWRNPDFNTRGVTLG